MGHNSQLASNVRRLVVGFVVCAIVALIVLPLRRGSVDEVEREKSLAAQQLRGIDMMVGLSIREAFRDKKFPDTIDALAELATTDQRGVNRVRAGTYGEIDLTTLRFQPSMSASNNFQISYRVAAHLLHAPEVSFLAMTVEYPSDDNEPVAVQMTWE